MVMSSIKSLLLEFQLSIPKVFSSFPKNPFWNHHNYMWDSITKLNPSTQDRIVEKLTTKPKIRSKSKEKENSIEIMKKELDHKNNPLDYFVIYPQFFYYDSTYVDFLKNSHDSSTNLPFDFSKSDSFLVFMTQALVHKISRGTGTSVQAFELSPEKKKRSQDFQSLLSGFLNPSLNMSSPLTNPKLGLTLDSPSLELQEHISKITAQLQKQLDLYQTISYPKSFQNTYDSHSIIDQGTQTQAESNHSASSSNPLSSSLQLTLKDLLLDQLSENELVIIYRMLIFIDQHCHFSYPSQTTVKPGFITENTELSNQELNSLQDLQKDIGRQLIYVHKGTKIALSKIIQGLLQLSPIFAPMIKNIMKSPDSNDIISFDLDLPKCNLHTTKFAQDNCENGIKPLTFMDYQSILPADLERINYSNPFTQAMQDASTKSQVKNSTTLGHNKISNSQMNNPNQILIPFLEEASFLQPAFLTALFSLPSPTFSSYFQEFVINTYLDRENPLYTRKDLSTYLCLFQGQSWDFFLSHHLKTSSLVVHSCIYHSMLITRFFFGFRLDQFRTLPQLAKAVYLNRFFSSVKSTIHGHNQSPQDLLKTETQLVSVQEDISKDTQQHPADHLKGYTTRYGFIPRKLLTSTLFANKKKTFSGHSLGLDHLLDLPILPKKDSKEKNHSPKGTVLIENQPIYQDIKNSLQELEWTIKSFDDIFGSCTIQELKELLKRASNQKPKELPHQDHLQAALKLRIELQQNLQLAQKTKAIQDAYYPGHVEVYQAKVDKGYHYDFNSLYPFIMKSYDMPIGVPILWNGQELQQCFGYLKVKVTSPDLLKPLLPVKIANEDVIYPNGTWEAWYFSEEIKSAVKKGYQVEILQGYLYTRFPGKKLFGTFINNFNKVKSTSVQQLVEHLPQDLKIPSSICNSTSSQPFQDYSVKLICTLRKEFSKLMMNSVYGKISQHKLIYQSFIAADQVQTSRPMKEFYAPSIVPYLSTFRVGDPLNSQSNPISRILRHPSAFVSHHDSMENSPYYPQDNYKVNGILHQNQPNAIDLQTGFQLVTMPQTRKTPIYQDFSTRLSPDKFQNGANLAIGAAITAYARVLMHETFLSNPSIDVTYMDTDCVVTTAPLPSKLLSPNEIGKLKNVVTQERSKQNLPVSHHDKDNYFTQGFFPNIRSYGYLSHFSPPTSSFNNQSIAPYCHTTSVMGPVKQQQSLKIFSHFKQLCNTIFSHALVTTFSILPQLYRKQYKKDEEKHYIIYYSNPIHLGITVFKRYIDTLLWLRQHLSSNQNTIYIPSLLTTQLHLRRFYLYTSDNLARHPVVPTVYHSLPLTICDQLLPSNEITVTNLIGTYAYTPQKIFVGNILYNPAFHGPIHNILIHNSDQRRTIAQILYLKDLVFICKDILDNYQHFSQQFHNNMEQWVAHKLAISQPLGNETQQQYQERKAYWQKVVQVVFKMMVYYNYR
uniref:DNA-directed DNA polymerase n=1 Tax=Jakoba libera TaxID=143017 RepID=M4Q9T1_JAKLI|nr:DNA polymerase [Jakoba libera]AGH24172.1 DNA polymerase [Jakoba libera]